MRHLEVEVYLGAMMKESCFSSVQESLKENLPHWRTQGNEKFTKETLHPAVEFIRLHCDEEFDGSLVHTCSKNNHSPIFYPVFLNEGSTTETMGETDGDSPSSACVSWNVPSREFDGLWESLFFHDGVKKRLLSYALTSLQLAGRGVDPNIICCNRLILLHGPPGTGKTTLCKALAQKMSIRMHKQLPYALFVEVNCHSLFSKWFSESGKLVAKMFTTIREFASDPQTLVVVLIDEVESLTSARQASINNGEPSDAIRVVNAVLTELDLLRFHRNIFVFATSNLTECIDPAFADRADIMQYIGPPGSREIMLIMKSCIRELERIGILSECLIEEKKMMNIAQECDGLSGRAVRKLPLIALNEWNQETHASELKTLDGNMFLDLLLKAALRLQNDKKGLN